MISDTLQQLDEAWQLFEEKVDQGVLKKDIAAMLNDKGYTTLKGKPWTYQTLMLEQRKRLGLLRPRIKTRKLHDFKSIKDTLIEVPNYKISSEHLAMPDHRLIQFLMDEEGFSALETASILNEHSRLDHKGRTWNSQSVVYELGNRWMEHDAEQLPEINGSLSDFIGRSVKKDEREHNLDKRKGPNMKDAWELIKEQLEKGIKKKKVMHNLNLGGFSTRTGKPWTYQTLLLEIKRMELTGYFGRESVSMPIPTPAPKITTKVQAEDPIDIILAKARKLIQKKVVDNLNEKGSKTRSGKSWTYGVLLLELLKLDLDPESQTIVNSPVTYDDDKDYDSNLEDASTPNHPDSDANFSLFNELNL